MFASSSQVGKFEEDKLLKDQKVPYVEEGIFMGMDFLNVA